MITRALIFYVGSILLVVALVRWDSPKMATPYVSALSAMGIPAAANVMNAIVLTAVLSALNSGLYAASRMMFALTRHGDAPAALAKVNRRGVPVRAILIGTFFGYVSVVMSYVSPDTVFAFLVNSYGTVAIFVYVLSAVSQLKLRARLEHEAPEMLRVRMWCYPYLTCFAIVGMIGILVAMAFIPDQRTPLWLGVVSLGVLLVAYVWRARKCGVASTEPEFVDTTIGLVLIEARLTRGVCRAATRCRPVPMRSRYFDTTTAAVVAGGRAARKRITTDEDTLDVEIPRARRFAGLNNKIIVMYARRHKRAGYLGLPAGDV